MGARVTTQAVDAFRLVFGVTDHDAAYCSRCIPVEWEIPAAGKSLELAYKRTIWRYSGDESAAAFLDGRNWTGRPELRWAWTYHIVECTPRGVARSLRSFAVFESGTALACCACGARLLSRLEPVAAHAVVEYPGAKIF